MPKIVDHELQRQSIALAAGRAIARRGVDDATMVEIARQAGVTTGMITHYFASKAEILAAALNLVLKRMEQRMQDSRSGSDDPLFSLLRETLPVDAARRAECAVWVSFWGKVSSDPVLAAVNRELHVYAEDLYARAIRYAWSESADWTTPVFEAVHRSILNFLNGLTASAVTSPQSWPAKAQEEALKLHLELIYAWAESAVGRVRGTGH